MIEFFTPKKGRLLGILTSSVVLLVATPCVVCESASAQGLLNRIRARVDARMAFPPPPPPPPVLPANPYGYRSPAPPTGYNAPEQPTFGVEVAPVGFGPNRGLEVRGFRPDSPLPESGIRPGDVIVSVDGRRTDSMAAMLAARRQISPGETPTMQIVRGGQLYQVRLPAWPADERTGAGPRVAAKTPIDDPSIVSSPIETPPYRVAPPERPPIEGRLDGLAPARPHAALGISARDASPQRGVIVVEVNDGSAGKIAGIEVNDRIVAASGRLVRNKDGLIRELALSKPGDSLTLGIVRGDAMRNVIVEMGGPDGKLARVASDVAKSTGPPAKAENGPTTGEEAANSASSLLSGVGSALGNFFGGAPAPPQAPAESSDDEADEQADQVFELPAPAAEPDSQSSDPLALPEDE